MLHKLNSTHSAESEISAFSAPRILSRSIYLVPFKFSDPKIHKHKLSSSYITSPLTSDTRQSNSTNCRPMRGLRNLIPPPALRASSRLYSASSRPSIIMAGKNKTGETDNSGSLPPLSASDFRAYNRMSEQMEGFHSHFRLTWKQLWDACNSTGKRPSGLSARQMIMMGLQFCSQLDFHHSIEEQHIFPVLAKKMPEFRKELDLLKQHKQIHAGLEKLEAYLENCRSGEEDLRREEVRRLMDVFGKVLWQHLDEEVQTLKAENMRKYWSVEEMRRLPM